MSSSTFESAVFSLARGLEAYGFEGLVSSPDRLRTLLEQSCPSSPDLVEAICTVARTRDVSKLLHSDATLAEETLFRQLPMRYVLLLQAVLFESNQEFMLDHFR